MKRSRALVLSLLLVTFVIAGFAASLTSVNRNGGWPPQGKSFNFGGPFEIYYQQVPTTLKDVDSYSGDNRIIQYEFYNSTVGAVTLTVQTKDASPLPLPGNGSIAAGQTVIFNLPAGRLVKNGWSVQASGTGVFFSAVWTH